MGSGQVVVRLNLNKDGYSAGMTAARKEAQALEQVIAATGQHTVTSMQAASAAIRTLEGGMQNNIRAAERFIGMIPGVGAALQAAFPVVGGIAFAGVIAKIAEEAFKAIHNLNQIRNVANESFGKLNEGAQKSADTLRVTNDKLEQQIASLEHKPVNNLALALDEARVRADELASSLNSDYEQVKKLIEQTQSGFLSKLFNKGIDSQLGSGMQDQLANIRTLARQQRDELHRGDQEAAESTAAKLRAAQDAAIKFADSEISKRSGVANAGTAREAAYSKVYGDQGTNFDAINQFKDLVVNQEDTADQQKRNTGDQEQLRKLEEQKRAAEAMKQAQEEIVKMWRQQLDAQKPYFDDMLLGEARFWVQRMEEAKKGSLSYLTALDEVNKDLGRMHAENLRAQKEFDKTSDEVYGGSIDLSRSDTSTDKEQGREAAEFLKTLNQGISQHEANAAAIAEESLQMEVLTGRMSTLAAAQALAALHAQQYADAQHQVSMALDAANSLPDSLSKSATIAGLNNQSAQMEGQHQLQMARDQQSVASQQLGPATQQALGTMVNEWTNMTRSIVETMTRGIDSLNGEIAKAMTGHGSKAGFGQVFSQAGEGLAKTALQSAEGNALKYFSHGKLGGAKADGSDLNPWYVIIKAGQGAGGGIGTSSSAVSAGIGLAGLIPGGSFIQPFISSLLPHFAGGGDVLAGHPAMVGENGPEMFMPRSAGRIVPNHQLGGGDTHIHVDARGSNDPAAIHAAIMRAAPAMISASLQAQHNAAKRAPSGR